MASAGKTQASNECYCLKIPYLLVPSGERWGPKWKAELDVEEEARQPKWLKLVVEVSGVRAEMQAEPTMWEILLEHSELLVDMQELFTKQLEEMKRLWKAVLVIRFAIDEVMEWMSQMEEGSGNGNNGARSI